ncbi:glycerophosphoryl diester phosphodiesterase [Isoptericola jiangsuensis]|uniref:Glycerophosphoryl diester phosphodiesterase n=1 Tax=Isoptericola jiangsuensis TaxID=548579 RepID=A0A2A9ETG0_9MICO|nr:glycerophosphodiester phosphodiesterase family protein [Isoptericola jiangsuensis]PFG41856.1 glycerophosphoryl diester phosphodiesterase [Isoptericola jiangsuensis]
MTVLLDPILPAPLVVAHRGYAAVAPQNTMASFEAAWRSGAPALELDVRLSADGVPVVIHDPVVDRVTDGSGAVADLDGATIAGLDAGARFSEHLAGQHVPTFAQVLRFLARRPGLDLLCEYKGVWTPEQLAPTTRALDAAGMAGRVLVQGFRRETVAALREAAPHLPRGLLCDAAPDDLIEAALDLGAVTVNPSVAAVLADPDLVRRAHDAGLRVMPWTANEPSLWRGLVAAGVDAIITDRPGELTGWLAGRADA